MDQPIKNKYNRVMSRVFNNCSFNDRPESSVIRHEFTSTNIGAKRLMKVKSGLFYELPKVLHNYIPELNDNTKIKSVIPKKSSIVKPKKTLKSLKVERPHILSTVKPRDYLTKSSTLNSKSYMRDESLDRVVHNLKKDERSYNKYIFLNASESKLKQLKNEIDNYREQERMLEFKTRMYEKCGITLDDNGQVCNEKAVQTIIGDTATTTERTPQQHADAGTLVPNKQVMPCPIDRYMVDSSRGIEVVDILKDDSWTAESTLRPEDELVLRKLRDLLQSTADDLKELSTELRTTREFGSPSKAPIMPLDEEFNQKVRIEHLVNAKFHGHKVDVDNDSTDKSEVQKLDIGKKMSKSTGIQVELKPNVTDLPKTNNKGKIVKPSQIKIQESSIQKKGEKDISALRIVRELGSDNKNNENNTITNEHTKQNKLPSNSVAYREMSHTYLEQNNRVQTLVKKLNVQKMPSISIRGELEQQEVLHLDIFPRPDCVKKHLISKNNTGVIEVQHNAELTLTDSPKNIRHNKIIQTEAFSEDSQGVAQNIQTSRKILKMSAYESSDYNSSDARNSISTTKKKAKNAHLKSTSSKVPNTNNIKLKSNSQCFSIDDWKKKLNTVYAQPSTSKRTLSCVKSKKKIDVKNISSQKSNTSNSSARSNTTKLNNVEYIPYSKLTLGGVKLSDIERKVSDVKKKANEPLSPILDKILNDRKNTSQEEENINVKVLSTSDENLLREVVEIERNVNRVIDSNFIKMPQNISKNGATSGENSKNNIDENSSYDDDFEEAEQTTEHSMSLENKENPNKFDSTRLKTLNKISSDLDFDKEIKLQNSDMEDSLNDTKNKTFNLSFKNSVDIFEFIHSIDTQDMGTQSNATRQLSLKETQTSPRQESTANITNINPIHNDLWPSTIDKGEIEKMFKLEKEFIRQLILDEYTDVVERDIMKSSTSKYPKEKEQNKNVAILQKNTQTSPAHVKNVMTSPKKTKTRTTSPISLISHVPPYTSPMGDDITEDNTSSHKLSKESHCNNDLDISINLSSPRFNLKLPQSSSEVLSNIDFSACSRKGNHKKATSSTINSSSSVDADRSDSELSSVGEIKFRLRRNYISDPFIKLSSDSSSTSALSKSTSEVQSRIGPLKSEGEISMGHL